MYSTHLPAIDPRLFVGSYEAVHDETWSRGICTAFCDDKFGHLQQHIFYDTANPEHQSESDAAFMIHRGAEMLAMMLPDDDDSDPGTSKDRVLVNCHMGMNRSASIIAAYAVGYIGWPPKHAIAYLRQRNAETRHRSAITNRVFESIVSSIKPREFVTHPRSFVRFPPPPPPPPSLPWPEAGGRSGSTAYT